MAKGQRTAEGWTKDVIGLSKTTSTLLKASQKAGDARIDLEYYLLDKERAAAEDPEYILANPEELDGIIAALENVERRLVALASATMEAHVDTADDLV